MAFWTDSTKWPGYGVGAWIIVCPQCLLVIHLYNIMTTFSKQFIKTRNMYKMNATEAMYFKHPIFNHIFLTKLKKIFFIKVTKDS